MKALQPIERIKTVFNHNTLVIGPSSDPPASSCGQVSPTNRHRPDRDYRVKSTTLAYQLGLQRNLGVNIMQRTDFLRPMLAKADFMGFTEIH